MDKFVFQSDGICCFLVTKSCQLSVTPWTATHQASLTFTISQSLLKLMSIESMMPFNHLILGCPFTSCLQSFPVSRSFPMSWVFPSNSQNIGASAPASASVFPMNIQGWYPLEVTGLTTSCPWNSQESSSAPQLVSGKTTALNIWTLVSKVISLLFNTLSSFTIAFLPRSKLLISLLQSSPAVILEPPKIKSVTLSTFSPSSCHEVMRIVSTSI